MASSLSNPRARLEALLDLINAAARDAIAEYERTSCIPSLDDPHAQDATEQSLGLRKAVRILEGACEQLCTTLAPPTHTLLNRSYSHFEPACMRVVIESDVAGILVKHPEGMAVADLAKETGIQADKLLQILRFLAVKNCFKEVRQGVFSNNRLSSRLVANTHVADALLFMSGATPPGANNLHACLTDVGFEDVPAKSPFMYAIRDQGRSDLFDWLKHNPSWGKVFGSAMVGFMEVFGDGHILAQTYPFAELPSDATFCDVGSGIGHISMSIARQYPNIRVTLQDLPNVIEGGRKFFAVEYPQAIQDGRIDFVPIDFFKESPVKNQDIYYLRHVIHNWNDDKCILILKSIRETMKPQSRLLIHDFVLWDFHDSELSDQGGIVAAHEPLPSNFGAGSILPHFQDMNMMCLLNSKERSLSEFKALGAASGLEFVRLWDFAYNGVVEFKLPA